MLLIPAVSCTMKRYPETKPMSSRALKYIAASFASRRLLLGGEIFFLVVMKPYEF